MYAGLNLSESRHLTALVLVFPKQGEYHVVPNLWRPEDGLREKATSEKVACKIWAEHGYLKVISGPVIQPEVIAIAVAEVDEEYVIQHLPYDPWRISDFKRELDNIDAQIPMQLFRQFYRDMAPLVDKLEHFVARRKLRHGGHPILNMCAARAVI